MPFPQIENNEKINKFVIGLKTIITSPSLKILITSLKRYQRRKYDEREEKFVHSLMLELCTFTTFSD